MGLQGITDSGTIIYKGKSSYEVVQKILDNIDSGIVVCATDSGEVLFENRIAARVPEIHRTIMDCIHNALESGDVQGRIGTPMERYNTESGLWFEVKFTQLVWISGINAIAASAADITQKKKNQQKIEYQAHNDFLTGLYNRMKCEVDLRKAIKDSVQNGNKGAVLFIDLDDFKHINDTYGHIFGDQVIRRVAEIMQVLVGQRGVIGRFGGDEYVILLEKVETREQLKTLLKTIAKEFALAFDPKTHVTASIGVSEYPVDGSEYEELMRKADKALYLAKEKGKNRHIIYEERLHGKLESDDMQNMAMAYAVSKEKKREVITKMITELCVSDVNSIVKKEERLQQIRSLFDLDGITIYSESGAQLVCRNGNYMVEVPDGRGLFEDEKYLALFGDDDNFIESNTLKLRSQDPAAFAVMQKQEIGAFLQCLCRKEGVPNVIVNYDVFNRNRKWSDEDITLLTILGHCIGNLLNYSE